MTFLSNVQQGYVTWEGYTRSTPWEVDGGQETELELIWSRGRASKKQSGAGSTALGEAAGWRRQPGTGLQLHVRGLAG